jgi:hypothetical protein
MSCRRNNDKLHDISARNFMKPFEYEQNACLLELENVIVELQLQHFVAEIDAKLLERVGLRGGRNVVGRWAIVTQSGR